MWNEFLDEAKSARKYDNTPVIVLGNKHSGKRSLVDSLVEISKTTLYNKRMPTHLESNKMRLKGLAPVIDYAYLNVLDLSDPDYRTHSKLEIYMVEDPNNPNMYAQLEKAEILKRAVVMIMLDFTHPWSFMEELDQWIHFLYELQRKAGLSIVELEAMGKRVTDAYTAYKEPQFDESGKLKKSFDLQSPQQEPEMPIPEGILENNIRFPFMVCVNKSDLQSSVLREESAYKSSFIMYHLRKFCLKYGGSLIYTSIKNNANLNTLYEYILYRSYQMPLKFKPEAINEEAVFIPLGFDSPALLEDSLINMDASCSYSEVVSAPINKKVVKEEVIAEDDSEYFKKYINTTSSVTASTISNNVNSSNADQSSSTSSVKTTEATDFFKRLLNSSNAANVNHTPANNDERKKAEAESTLYQYTRQAKLNRSNAQKQENN